MKRYLDSLPCMGQFSDEDVIGLTHFERLFVRDELLIPDFGAWKTLKCDLHTHTVFSDGLVWPDARVYEAWQEGLDAVAITDHLGYQHNTQWLRGNLNDAYQIALRAAQDMDFLVIPGAEITHDKPLGHLNLLFIQDAMRLTAEDPMLVIDEALRQGAFIAWNHPGWPDNEVYRYPVHDRLINEGRIHGIEVMNYRDFYPAALQWCLDFQKAVLATADAHCPAQSMYRPHLRPMTLVFAREKSLEGIKEALFAGRSLAFFDDMLAGSPEFLEPLVRASLVIRKMSNHCLSVTNLSDIPYRISQDGVLSLVPGRKTVILSPFRGSPWIFKNCLTGKDSCLSLSMADCIG